MTALASTHDSRGIDWLGTIAAKRRIALLTVATILAVFPSVGHAPPPVPPPLTQSAPAPSAFEGVINPATSGESREPPLDQSRPPTIVQETDVTKSAARDDTASRSRHRLVKETAAPINSSMMTRLSADQVANEWEVHVQNQKIALQAYEDGVKTGVALNKNLVELYKTQLTLTYILTVFVLSMVVVAVAISYQQFRRDDGEDSNSTLKFGATGIEISSSVIGLFILVAAMFFFYLYIDRVYRIRPLEQFAAPSNATLLDAKR